jgi:peptidoglycan/xylan/chitin deacetylase (PgdA/CDA1 family)
MDHKHYHFSPIHSRREWHWPHEAALAFHVIVTVEHFEITPPAGSVRDQRFLSEFGPFQPDYRTWTQREYGNRVGFFRILEVLDRHGINPGMAIGSSAAERYPEIIDEIRKRGWEILGHGTHATRLLSEAMSESEEQQTIQSAIATLQHVTGQMPKGWMGQDQGESTRTLRLLREAGIDYVVDWSNDDQAYMIAPDLVSLPLQVEWDDAQMFWLRRIETNRYPDLTRDAAAYLAREGKTAARNFGLTIHPWLFGMAHRIRYLDEALTKIKSISEIWHAQPGDIARWARQNLT